VADEVDETHGEACAPELLKRMLFGHDPHEEDADDHAMDEPEE
jgi:hypothetical protein